MLKFIGCMMILLASCGFACSIRIEIKRHLEMLCRIRKLLTDIFYEEQYSMQPVEMILMYSIRTDEECLNILLNRIGKSLLQKEAGRGEEIWRAAFLEYQKQLGLNEEELDIVANAGSAYFGKCMEENQKLLSFYLERFNELIVTERKERREKQKVYQTVSVMCGLILIILLV